MLELPLPGQEADSNLFFSQAFKVVVCNFSVHGQVLLRSCLWQYWLGIAATSGKGGGRLSHLRLSFKVRQQPQFKLLAGSILMVHHCAPHLVEGWAVQGYESESPRLLPVRVGELP